MRKRIQIIIVSLLALLFLAGCSRSIFSRSIFSSITNSPNNVQSTMKDALKYKQTTLIVVSSKCPDCKRDRSQIISGVKKLRKNGHHVVVFDIDQLKKKDVQYLVKEIPGVSYKTGLATPTFIDLQSSEEHHFFHANYVMRDKATANQIDSFFKRVGEE